MALVQVSQAGLRRRVEDHRTGRFRVARDDVEGDQMPSMEDPVEIKGNVAGPVADALAALNLDGGSDRRIRSADLVS